VKPSFFCLLVCLLDAFVANFLFFFLWGCLMVEMGLMPSSSSLCFVDTGGTSPTLQLYVPEATDW